MRAVGEESGRSCAEEGGDLVTFVRDVRDGVVDGVDEENDLRGGIGDRSLDCVEGENLLGLAVVEDCEVRLAKGGDDFAGVVGDGDVERDGGGSGGGLLLCDERDREESWKQEPG